MRVPTPTATEITAAAITATAITATAITATETTATETTATETTATAITATAITAAATTAAAAVIGVRNEKMKEIVAHLSATITEAESGYLAMAAVVEMVEDAEVAVNAEITEAVAVSTVGMAVAVAVAVAATTVIIEMMETGIRGVKGTLIDGVKNGARRTLGIEEKATKNVTTMNQASGGDMMEVIKIGSKLVVLI